MLTLTPQCDFNGCHPQGDLQWGIFIVLVSLAVVSRLADGIPITKGIAQTVQTWALTGTGVVFFILILLQLCAYASTTASRLADGTFTRTTDAAYHALYEGFFDPAFQLTRQHPSPCQGTLVTDIDTSREPGRTAFLFLGYFLYPIDIRMNSTTKQNECLVFFKKTGVEDRIAEGR